MQPLRVRSALVWVSLFLVAPALLPLGAAQATPTLRADLLRIDIDIHDPLAVTHASLGVTNPGAAPIETEIEFPLSTSAVLTNFTLTTHNRTLVGIVLERETAEAVYNASKETGADTVLLTSSGEGRLALKLHVAAESHVTLNATWAEVLPLDLGNQTYTFPLASFLSRYPTIDRFEFDANLSSRNGWQGVEGIGLATRPVQASDGRIAWSFAADDFVPADDVTLVLRPATSEFLTSLVLARQAANDALVAHIVPPGFGRDPLPLDVVFVLDRSGSMQGTKIEQARQALTTVLGQLRTQDTFGLVSFDDQIETYKPSLLAPTASNVRDARDWVSDIDDRGGTDIEGGVSRGLTLLGGEERVGVPTVILITDGLPSSGITDTREIIASLTGKNALGARVHVVGIGFDADNAFLGDIAARFRGFYQPIAQDGSVAAQLEGFYERVATPMLKDVQVGIDGVMLLDVHPSPLPDLYQGSSLVVVARADTTDLPDPVRIRLSGQDATGAVNFTFDIPRDDVVLQREVDRLWARQKANTLEREITLNNRQANVTAQRAQLLELGLSYQIETTLTGWVVVNVLDLVDPEIDVPLDLSGEPDANAELQRLVMDVTAGATTAAATQVGGIVGGGGGGATKTPGPALLLAVGTFAASLAVAARRRRV